MAQTYTSLHYHIVFSTKDRTPSLPEKIRARLWPYMGGIARENGMKADAIGGVADHAHLLIAIPARIPVAQAVQLIKGASSHWLKSNFPERPAFAWQDGYGAFTVSKSHVDAVRDYISRQPEHHRTKTFAEEYRSFLDQHGVTVDERYWLG